MIQRIERVVPSAVWIALAAALGLALSAGMATLALRRRARRQAARLAAVRAQALTDLLTGVLNRRGFLDAAERELARARRYRRPFALAFVDVRGLKAINDSEGHQAGDELLRQTARLLQESSRAHEVVGRIGGDELALLLPEHSSQEAKVAAARIMEKVAASREALRLRYPWDLTVGTAAYPGDGLTVDELLAAADRRLYEQRGIKLGQSGQNGSATSSANGANGEVAHTNGNRSNGTDRTMSRTNGNRGNGADRTTSRTNGNRAQGKQAGRRSANGARGNGNRNGSRVESLSHQSPTPSAAGQSRTPSAAGRSGSATHRRHSRGTAEALSTKGAQPVRE